MNTARFIWCDFGWWVHPNGQKKLLSWNAETKELAFWPLTRWEQPVALAVIPDEDEVRRRLDGWDAYNSTKEGLVWLANRLEGCR
jgi:hypothetical protein